MKKFLSCVLFFFLVFGAVFAQNVVEVFPSGEELDKGEANWLPKAVEERFEANLSKFTDFEIVNGSNKRQIMNIQRESESAAYSSSLDVGQLTNASHGIFLTVRKAGGRYTISLSFTDLTSGKNLAVLVSRAKDSVDDLYISNGCAIDELTVDFCDALGIPLSTAQQYVLLNGSSDLSDSDKNRMLEQDIKNYSDRLKDLDKEINLLTKSTDLDASVIQKQLELEKILTEEKLRKSQEDKKRAREEADRKRNDEIKDMERSQEQKDKIQKMSDDLDKKIKEVREHKLENSSVLGKIKIVESIKKAYIEILDELEGEKAVIFDKANKIIEQRSAEILDAPLLNSEKDSNGKITEKASSNRQKKIDEMKKSVYKDAQKEADEMEDKVSKQKKDLLREIDKGYRNLKSTTITTLGDDLIVVLDNYDGNRFGWDIYITVQSDDVIIFQTKSFLSFEDLTGHKPVTDYNQWGYDAYNKELDLYVSMFSRGDPVLTFALDYSVEPFSKSYPSKYNFKFSNFRFYKTSTLTVLNDEIVSFPNGHLEIEESNQERQMYPSYDLRTEEDFAREEEEFKKQMEAQAAAELAAQNAADGSGSGENGEYGDEDVVINLEDGHELTGEEKKLLVKAKLKKFVENNPGRTMVGVNYGPMFYHLLGQDIQIEAAYGFLPFLYAGYRMDFLIINDDWSNYYKIGSKAAFIFSNKLEIGVSLNVIKNFEFFTSFGIGFSSYIPNHMHFDKDENGNYPSLPANQSNFIYGFDIGASYNITDHFIASASFNFTDIVGRSARANLTKSKINYTTGLNVGLGYRF